MKRKKFLHVFIRKISDREFVKLVEVKVICHLLHNAAMQIMSEFSAVNDVIAATKAATKKNVTRSEQFSSFGGKSGPVVTRWGTSINAAFWYGEHWNTLKEIILGFVGEGVLVTKANAAASCFEVPKQLSSICRLFSHVPSLILELEKKQL